MCLDLLAFERNVLSKIYGPIEERGECTIRYNKELYQLYRSTDVITSIIIARLRWTGHVERMSGEDILKRIMDCKPEGRRRIGRPKLRWVDGVMMDVKKLGIKNW
jgi:hypothetical protein